MINFAPEPEVILLQEDNRLAQWVIYALRRGSGLLETLPMVDGSLYGLPHSSRSAHLLWGGPPSYPDPRERTLGHPEIDRLQAYRLFRPTDYPEAHASTGTRII